MADARTTPLAADERKRAREMAEAHAPDSVILGALKADVYDSVPIGPARDAMLMALECMHPEDHRELNAYRDRGRARLHLVLYACAMSYRINQSKERLDLAGPDAREEEFAEVDAKSASTAQFLGRVLLTMDPDALKEEAQAEAERFARMSEDEKQRAWMQIGSAMGVDNETIRHVGERLGFTMSVVQGGAA